MVPTSAPCMLQRPSWIAHGNDDPWAAPEREIEIEVVPLAWVALVSPETPLYGPTPFILPLQSSPCFVGDSTSTSTLPVAGLVEVRTQAVARMAAQRSPIARICCNPPVFGLAPCSVRRRLIAHAARHRSCSLRARAPSWGGKESAKPD